MTNNEQLMLNILKKVPSALIILPKKLKNNPNFMLEAIKIDSHCVYVASEELKNKIYSVIEEISCDNEAQAEVFSESTIDDVFTTKNTLKIINLK